MSGSLSNTQQPIEGTPPGILASLFGLVKAAVYPFDPVLTGMVAAGLCLEALSRFLGLTRAALYEHIVRLGLRTPPDAPFRSAGARGWSDEDVRRLVAWRPVGVHPEVIGESLSKRRKAAAVRAKCRRIGLAAPSRRLLFRPDPAALRKLTGPGPADASLSPAAKYGRPAGPTLPGFEAAPQSRPTRRTGGMRDLAHAEDQPELELLADIGLTEQAGPVVPEIPTVTASDLAEPGAAASDAVDTSAARPKSAARNRPGRSFLKPQGVTTANPLGEPGAAASDAVDTSVAAAEVGRTEQAEPIVPETPTVTARDLAEPSGAASDAVDTSAAAAEAGRTEQAGPLLPEIPAVKASNRAERDAAASDASDRSTACAEARPIPQTIEDVDFADLRWIGRLRSPAAHLPATWAIGMLVMSGLHWREAARMTGKSAAALRTLRTRIGAPVDHDREKSTSTFDPVVATATREKGHWIVRKGLRTEDQRGPVTYFWVSRHDRSTWYPPTRRKRDHLIEGRSPIMTIFTRAMLGDEAARYEPRSARAGSPAMAS